MANLSKIRHLLDSYGVDVSNLTDDDLQERLRTFQKRAVQRELTVEDLSSDRLVLRSGKEKELANFIFNNGVPIDVLNKYFRVRNERKSKENGKVEVVNSGSVNSSTEVVVEETLEEVFA